MITITKTMRPMFLLLLAAGCTQGAPTDQIPGMGVGAQPLSENLDPYCGYGWSSDYTGVDGTKKHTEMLVRVTRDDAGQAVSESGTDANGKVVYTGTLAYDAMGNLTDQEQSANGENDYYRLDYDSFGRAIRVAQGDNLNGEWGVDTYKYGGDENPTSSHSVLFGAASDSTYHYDEDGRVIEIDQDDGPDGVIDQVEHIAYDDAARVRTMSATNSAGEVVASSTSKYDAQNHLVASQHLSTENGYRNNARSEYTYAGGHLQAESWTTDSTTVADGSTFSNTMRMDLHYDCK
jgi:hypothetical protein